MAKDLADQRARQGGRGRPVLGVLIGSCLLLGIALIAFMVWAGRQSPTVPNQVTNSGASSSNTSRVPAENPAYPSPASPKAGTSGSAPARP